MENHCENCGASNPEVRDNYTVCCNELVCNGPGRGAFEADRKRIPAQDPAVMPLLAGLQVGEGLPILDGWLRGWDRANLGRQS